MKKIQSIILALALLLCAVFVPAGITVSADTAVDAWDGTVAESYAGGSGSDTDPYLIATPEQLAKLRCDDSTAGKYYKLTSDIYLNDVSKENWTESARGWYAYSDEAEVKFCGHLDGDGHTVYGLYYNGSEGYFGLFCRTQDYANNVSIANLCMSDASVTTTGDYAGALVGFHYNNTLGYTFENCIINDTVCITANTYAGGLVGLSQSNTIVKSCASYATVSAANKGGFAGCFKANTKSLTISNSFAIGNAFVGNGTATTVTNSYENVDATAIPGDNAMTAMPDLGWDATWFTIDGAYPTNIAFYTVPTEVPWDGTIAKNYASGSGTKTDPYIIQTAEQLAKLVNTETANAKGLYYKLTADIYLNDISQENWKDSAKGWYVGSSTLRFVGNFDGNGHTVYGLYYNGTAVAGLFPLADTYYNSTSVSNLRISDAYISTSSQYAGAIFGFAYKNSNNYTATFNNCVVENSVSVTSSASNGYVGGMCGYAQTMGGVYVNDSASFASVSATNCGAFLGSAGCTLFATDSFADAKFSKATTTLNNSYENVTADSIKGDNAMTAMPLLKWHTVWATVEGSVPQNTVFYNGTYASGNGTEADPYIISSGYLLRKAIYTDYGMLADGSKAYYKLDRDLYLNSTEADNWTETANDWCDLTAENTEFIGSIDGDGFTVYGLYYAGSTDASVNGGLVPLAGGDAQIKNLRIEKAYVSSQRAGGIIGRIGGTASVENCSVVGLTATGYWTGAVIGLATNGTDITVSNCYAVDCDLTTTGTSSSYSPALYGDAYSVTLKLENCYLEGYYIKPVKEDGGVRAGTAVNCYYTVTNDATRLPTSDSGCTQIVNGDFSAIENFPTDVWYQAGNKAPLLRVRGVRLMDISGDDNAVIDAQDTAALRLNLIGDAGYQNIIGDTDQNGSINICDLVKAELIISSK